MGQQMSGFLHQKSNTSFQARGIVSADNSNQVFTPDVEQLQLGCAMKNADFR
jgi:hypothetical protein